MRNRILLRPTDILVCIHENNIFYTDVRAEDSPTLIVRVEETFDDISANYNFFIAQHILHIETVPRLTEFYRKMQQYEN